MLRSAAFTEYSGETWCLLLILSISSKFTPNNSFIFSLKVTIYAVKNPTGNTTDLNEKLSHVKDYMTRDDILSVLLDEDGNLNPNLTNDKELEVKRCYKRQEHEK